jgi:uncharacterized protein
LQIIAETTLYSASDIVNFLECEHLTSLDLIHLQTPLQKTESDDQTKLIQEKGYAHEAAFEEALKQQYGSIVNIGEETSDIGEMVKKTLDAMN